MQIEGEHKRAVEEAQRIFKETRMRLLDPPSEVNEPGTQPETTSESKFIVGLWKAKKPEKLDVFGVRPYELIIGSAAFSLYAHQDGSSILRFKTDTGTKFNLEELERLAFNQLPQAVYGFNQAPDVEQLYENTQVKLVRDGDGIEELTPQVYDLARLSDRGLYKMKLALPREQKEVWFQVKGDKQYGIYANKTDESEIRTMGIMLGTYPWNDALLNFALGHHMGSERLKMLSTEQREDVLNRMNSVLGF